MRIGMQRPLTRCRQGDGSQIDRRVGYVAVVPRATAIRLNRFGVARFGLQGHPAQTVDDREYEANGQKRIGEGASHSCLTSIFGLSELSVLYLRLSSPVSSKKAAMRYSTLWNGSHASPAAAARRSSSPRQPRLPRPLSAGCHSRGTGLRAYRRASAFRPIGPTRFSSSRRAVRLAPRDRVATRFARRPRKAHPRTARTTSTIRWTACSFSLSGTVWPV